MEATYAAIDPVGESGVVLGKSAARLRSLEGKRIGLLDNSKEYARKLLDILEARLRDRVPGLTILRFSSQTPTTHEPELLSRIARECDGVIEGIGD
ncbi:MAG: hypothetical protein HYX90_09245 [Chloroflexi bacterium]|nr:hypothetical protein [Chloroflexota bacterium]